MEFAYVWRVVCHTPDSASGLAVSRALGDRDFKEPRRSGPFQHVHRQLTACKGTTCANTAMCCSVPCLGLYQNASCCAGW